MTHTQKPWSWDIREAPACSYLHGRSDEDIILEVTPECLPSAEDQALISAAPELLEACKAVLSMADRIKPLSEVDAEITLELHKLLDAVIAKAEGRGK